MTTEHGRTSRLVNLARKHDPKLLARAIDKHHQNEARRSLRDQAYYLLEELGDFAEDLVTDIIEEDDKIGQMASLVGNNWGRDKLICTVFNEMAKSMQDVVMEGSESQLRYLVDKYGLERTQEMVKLIKT